MGRRSRRYIVLRGEMELHGFSRRQADRLARMIETPDGGDTMGKHDKPGSADSKDSKGGGKHESNVTKIGSKGGKK